MKLILFSFLIFTISWSSRGVVKAKSLPENSATESSIVSSTVVWNAESDLNSLESDPTASSALSSSTAAPSTETSTSVAASSQSSSSESSLSTESDSSQSSPAAPVIVSSSLQVLSTSPPLIDSASEPSSSTVSPSTENIFTSTAESPVEVSSETPTTTSTIETTTTSTEPPTTVSPLNRSINVTDSIKEINFCDFQLCRKGKFHIACGHNNTIAEKCYDYSEIVDVSDAKTIILDRHNFFRNWIASGNLTGYEPASHMPSMEWDETLEYLATLNVLSCEFEHDECRNTPQFKYSGQNLATWGMKGIDFPIGKLFSMSIKSWFDEFQKADMQIINDFQPGNSAGHFTVTVSDKNTKLGCAALKQNLEYGEKKYLLACNYATNNIVGTRIYNSGESASKCSSVDPGYENLCSSSDKIVDLSQ